MSEIKPRDFETDRVFPKLVIYAHESFAALYVNGELDCASEEYVVVEKALEHLGVDVIRDDVFMRGSRSTADTARTLAQVEEYHQVRERDRNEAKLLRVQANNLIRQAEELEKKHRRR